ncbi:MAG: endonuclease domain-containing protein [Bacteroidetes bacterium]|nr:endonuclease domain-containing protein [Bacteroidota bacterium]
MKLNVQVHNKKSLKEIRRQLRNNLTYTESELWNYLKNRKLGGKKFRRQHSIGNYIVDFNCPEERIIIELDGEVHTIKGQKLKDKERDETLQQMGYKVLRFTNREVIADVQKVLDTIRRNFIPPPFTRRGPGGGFTV